MAVIFEGCGEDAEVEATVAAGAGVSGTGGECHRRLFGVAAYVGRGCSRSDYVGLVELLTIHVQQRNHLESVLGGPKSYDIGADCPRFAERLREPVNQQATLHLRSINPPPPLVFMS